VIAGVHLEVWLICGYAVFLVFTASVLEHLAWLLPIIRKRCFLNMSRHGSDGLVEFDAKVVEITVG